MNETPRAVELAEDRVPHEGIEGTIGELVELYGGTLGAARERQQELTLPLRRGVAAAGSIACTLSWSMDDADEATVRLVCDRDVDASKGQRIALLLAGVVGALAFTVWPFFAHGTELGTVAWLGGILAIAVYFMTLRRTSGGIAYDFLQRLARRQRERLLEKESA